MRIAIDRPSAKPRGEADRPHEGASPAILDAAGGVMPQVAPSDEPAALQRHGGEEPASDDPTRVRDAGSRGISGASGPLPYLEKIQKAFGRHDVSGIAAHTDAAAAAGAEAMGAVAFTMGHHVAFAGKPSLYTAAHEAAHVIQQRSGVELAGGVGRAGDRYEQHADEVAQRVVAGLSSESLLDSHGAGARPWGRSHATDSAKRQAERMADEPASAAVQAQDLVPAKSAKSASSASAQVKRTPMPPLEITLAEMCALAVFCILEGAGDLTNTNEQLKVAAVIINRTNSPNWEKEYGGTITGQAFAEKQFEVVKTYGLELANLDSYDKAVETLSKAKHITLEESRTRIWAFVRAAADPSQYGEAVEAVGGNTGFRGVNDVNVFRRESPYDATNLASEQPSCIVTASGEF